MKKGKNGKCVTQDSTCKILSEKNNYIKRGTLKKGKNSNFVTQDSTRKLFFRKINYIKRGTLKKGKNSKSVTQALFENFIGKKSISRELP